MKLRALLHVSWLALPACAAIWGFEDGHLGGSGDLEDGSTSTDSATLQDAGLDLDATSDAAPPNCSARQPDPDGYFVDNGTGTDIDGCGTPNAPCRNVSWVFEHYNPQFHPVVHVAVADYTGSLVTPEVTRNLGLLVEGRWGVRFEGAQRRWTPYCGPVPTRIFGTTSSVVYVESTYVPEEPADAGPLLDAAVDADVDVADADTDADVDDRDADVDAADAAPPPYDLVLSSLEIISKPVAATGESLYGIVARRARIALLDVSLVAAAGGSGLVGNDGPPGGAPSANNCPSGSGNPGPDGTNAPPATPGRFDETGYLGSVSSAASGNPGTQGAGGRPTSGCLLGLLGDGAPGCGGGGGAGGASGGAGGASVGLFLWSAHSTFSRVALATGAGGNGGGGGRGGPGAAGVHGDGCLVNGVLGKPGSLGGTGGAGGAGGAAAGGPSVCVVRLARSVTAGFDPQTCRIATGGLGGDLPEKAPDGFAGALYTESDGGTEPSP